MAATVASAPGGVLRAAPAAPTLRLRDGVTVEDGGAPGRLVLHDRRSARRFTVGEPEHDLVRLLEAGTTREPLQRLVATVDPAVAVDEWLALYDGLHLLHPGPRDLRGRLREELDRQVLDGVRSAVDQASALPFYRARLGVERGSAIRSLDHYREVVPLLHRSEWRDAFPDQLLPGGTSLLELAGRPGTRIASSSGTTGDQVTVAHSAGYLDRVFRSTFQVRDIFDQRHALFGPLHCMSMSCNAPTVPFAERYTGEALLMGLPDPVHAGPHEAASALAELEETGIDVLVTNPFYLAAVSLAAERSGRALPALRELYLGYDFAQATTRAWLQDRYGIVAGDVHGMTEAGFQLMRSCEAGTIHLNEPFFAFELVPDGDSHRLVVTTTGGPLIPLLRYRTSDLFLVEDRPPCPCGSVLASVAAFDGRDTDRIVIGASPFTLGAVDRSIGALPGVAFYQLVAGDPVRVLFAGDADPAAVADHVARALGELAGTPCPVTARAGGSFHRGAGEKFAPVVGGTAR